MSQPNPNKSRAPYYFISYSRRDYYLAESLSYDLTRKGIRTWLDSINLAPGGDWENQLRHAVSNSSGLILIGSRDSYGSPNVRDEWTYALKTNIPVFVAEFRRSKKPPVLEQFPSFDLSRDYECGLSEIIDLLSDERTADRSPILQISNKRFVPAAPDVCIIGAMLLAPFVYSAIEFPFIAIRDAADLSEALGVVLVGLAIIGVFCWFFAVSFLRRRMSWRRLQLVTWGWCVGLVLNLIATFAGFELPLSKGSWIGTPSELMAPEACIFYSLLLSSLYLLYIKKSPDILRWLPTGKAPDWLREKCYGSGSPPPAGMAPKLDTLTSFYLICDPEEQNMAAKLRSILVKRGCVEEEDSLRAKTCLLLITGNTRIANLMPLLNQSTDRLYPVLCTGINVDSCLDWLWRRQWVDFRTWVISRPKEGRLLPLVPESMTSIKLPNDVKASFYSMVAMASVVEVLSEYLEGHQIMILLRYAVWPLFIVPLLISSHLFLTRSVTGRAWRLLTGMAFVPGAACVAWGIAIWLFVPGAKIQSLSTIVILIALTATSVVFGRRSSVFLPSEVSVNPFTGRGTLRQSFMTPHTLIAFFVVVWLSRGLFYNLLAF